MGKGRLEMSGPVSIQPTCLHCHSGFAGFGLGNPPPDGYDSSIPPSKSDGMAVGAVWTVSGLIGLGAGYWLYKKKHTVAGVVVGLLFGSGAILGPLTIAGAGAVLK